MTERSKTLKEYPIILAMPGVGEILAPRLIAEIGDISRYHNASALVAYAGLDAPPSQSGNYISNNRSISKRGSASLRKTGYEIMKCLKTHKPTEDNAVYLFMLKKESEGKPLKVAKKDSFFNEPVILLKQSDSINFYCKYCLMYVVKPLILLDFQKNPIRTFRPFFEKQV